MIDTSREAVDALIKRLERDAIHAASSTEDDAADMLRALLAERDARKALAEAVRDYLDAAVSSPVLMEEALAAWDAAARGEDAAGERMGRRG